MGRIEKRPNLPLNMVQISLVISYKARGTPQYVDLITPDEVTQIRR